MYDDEVKYITVANVKSPVCGTCTHFVKCRKVNYKNKYGSFIIDAGYCDRSDPEEDMSSCAVGMIGPREEVKGRWCTHISCEIYDPIVKPKFDGLFKNTFLTIYPNRY